MIALIGACGAFVAIYIMFWAIDGQGLSLTGEEDLWDSFWIYAGIASVLGAICGFVKGDK